MAWIELLRRTDGYGTARRDHRLLYIGRRSPNARLGVVRVSVGRGELLGLHGELTCYGKRHYRSRGARVERMGFRRAFGLTFYARAYSGVSLSFYAGAW